MLPVEAIRAHEFSQQVRGRQAADLRIALCDANLDPTARTTTLEELRFMMWLTREAGFQDVKPLVGRPGWWAGIHRLMLHWSIQGGRIGDRISIDIRYCYTDDYDAVKLALDEWDGAGEPRGWHRHPMSGRRRVLGDPTTEYIDP